MKNFILLVFILIIIVGCQKDKNISIIDNDNQISQKLLDQKLNLGIDNVLNQKMMILARTMAFALRDKNVCSILNFKLAESDNKEKILDLKKWMQTNVNGLTVAYRMAKSGYMEKINGTEKKVTIEDLFKIVTSIKPGVDIYFPVDMHRNTWYNNLKKLLVASPDIANEWDKFPAYNLSGQQVMLDPNKVPNEPVLVILPCEHYGVHKGLRNKIEQQSTGGDGGGSSGGSGGSGGNSHPPLQDGARIKMYQMKQDVCEESWVRGDPEIRYSIKNSKNHDYLIKDENPGDKWDCTWHWDGIHHDYNWKTINHYDFFWHFNDYGNYVVYYFYESDGGTEVETDTYTVENAKFSFQRKVGDDEMGIKCVHKDDGYLEPGVDQAYDSGDMRFYIDWTNPSN